VIKNQLIRLRICGEEASGGNPTPKWKLRILLQFDVDKWVV